MAIDKAEMLREMQKEYGKDKGRLIFEKMMATRNRKKKKGSK